MTDIINQKFYIDDLRNIYCIDITNRNEKTWRSEIKEGWSSISKSKALEIANPTLTQQQIILIADTEKQYRLSEAAEIMAPFQDAVDLEIDTEEETTKLKEWKTYRVMLNRVDTSTAPDIEWPEKPQ